MVVKKDNIAILITFIFYGISVFFISSVLSPIKYERLNFLISELVTQPFSIPLWLNYFFAFGNLALIILIAKNLFVGKVYLIVGMVYALSPWTAYLLVAQSFYIFILFLILVILYSLILIKIGKEYLGSFLLIASTVASLYTSLLLWMLLPLILCSNLFIKFISLNKIKRSIIIIAVAVLPVVFCSLVNQVGIKNIFANQVKLFSDPKLINGVNVLQGESSISGYRYLSKLVENKYLYSFKYLIYKAIKNIVPATFFTPQEKLLNFSFSPPIYFGFIIPFFYGIYSLLKKPKLRKLILTSTLLIIPSFLAESLVDLNRLVIFFPMIIFIISFGLMLFYQYQKKTSFRFMLYLTFFLVLTQFLVTQFDITYREVTRYHRVFDRDIGIGKQ